METRKDLRRNVPVDAAKVIAISGTLLIHASAMGGFAWPVGSFNWTADLFWSSLLRCAVPLFFLCSGALLLPPEKDVTAGKVWRHYIPRILLALLFWAGAYGAFQLFMGWRQTGVWELTAIRQTLRDFLLFHHKSHLYYLHIILLVYALLPVTRLFAARADKKTLHYALWLWFLLGSVLPLLRTVPPLSLVGGIPAQYPINLTWGAVGYTLLGFALTRETPRARTGVLVYLLGLALTFFGTLSASLRAGELVPLFLQGNAPGVCLQAAGIFGFCQAAFCRMDACPGVENLSRSSFCVYLVHLFFLEWMVCHGFSAGVYSPVWAVPVLADLTFGVSYLTWLILRRFPLVNKYLI